MSAPRLTFTPAPGSPWRAVDAAPDASEKPAIEGVLGGENVAQNGILGNISQADLPRNEGHKKPGIAPGVLNFSATEAPPRAPVAIRPQATTRPMNNEFFN